MRAHCGAILARESGSYRFQGVCVGTIDSVQYVRLGCGDFPNEVTADQAINVIIGYIEARPVCDISKLHKPLDARVAGSFHRRRVVLGLRSGSFPNQS
jgi:hypothetical protein